MDNGLVLLAEFGDGDGRVLIEKMACCYLTYMCISLECCSVILILLPSTEESAINYELAILTFNILFWTFFL